MTRILILAQLAICSDSPAIDISAEITPKVSATRFGLPKGNVRTSEPGRRNGSFHYGIDFSSRSSRGRPAKVQFTAGVYGVAKIHKASKWNTVSVVLRNGNVIQFLHASRIFVKSGDRVTPTTILGRTGDTGSLGSIHLHVQARDRNGRFIDPDRAIQGHRNVRIGPRV